MRRKKFFLISLVAILLEWFHMGNTFRLWFSGREHVNPVNSFSYTYRTLRRKLANAFVKSDGGLGSTYITRINFFRIDYILHDKSLESYNFIKISVVLSDNYPMKCEIYFQRGFSD